MVQLRQAHRLHALICRECGANGGPLERWYDAPERWVSPVPGDRADLETVRLAFENAVRRHMMSDVPWGVLLSGGLDSSLVASVAQRLYAEHNQHGGWTSQLHTFAAKK